LHLRGAAPLGNDLVAAAGPHLSGEKLLAKDRADEEEYHERDGKSRQRAHTSLQSLKMDK
jgi:hypothetical protein